MGALNRERKTRVKDILVFIDSLVEWDEKVGWHIPSENITKLKDKLSEKGKSS